MESPYNQLSGFEGEALSDFGQEGFNEVLDSELAVEVSIYNYDLSECNTRRVVIQNNHQDTKLKTMSRAMFAPIGTCKAGMYVLYKNRFWLIVGIVDDNKVYEKAILLICNYKMTWVNDEDKVVQRWANAESASQYNNGETNMKFYFVRSDQLMVYMPDDDEVLKLNTGARFVIDKRCKMYEEDIDENATESLGHRLIVYKLTRSDTVLDDYTDSGIIGFIMTQDQQHTDDGFYRIGGKGYWLCGKSEAKPDTDNKITGNIDCDSDMLYINLEPCEYKAVFRDEDGNEVDASTIEYDFHIEFSAEEYEDSDFDYIDIRQSGQTISVSVNDSRLNGKTFKLVLKAAGLETTTKIIRIREFF